MKKTPDQGNAISEALRNLSLPSIVSWKLELQVHIMHKELDSSAEEEKVRANSDRECQNWQCKLEH